MLVAVALIVATVVLVRRVVADTSNTFSAVVTTDGVANLNFGGSGRVVAIKVRPGQTVRQGQLLARQANGASPDEVTADKDAITADNAQIKQLTQAGGDGSVSAALSDARHELVVDRARYAAHRAAAAAGYILAPSAGVVLAVNAQPGDTATGAGVRQYGAVDQSATVVQRPQFSLLPKGPQSTVTRTQAGLLPVVSVRTSSRWQLLAQVPEKGLRSVHVGSRVSIHVPAVRLDHFGGRVTQVLPSPVMASGSVMYRVLVSVNSATRTPPLPGMTADVRLLG